MPAPPRAGSCRGGATGAPASDPRTPQSEQRHAVVAASPGLRSVVTAGPQRLDALEVERVVDPAAGAALPDQPGGAQGAQVVRDQRRAQAEHLADVAHAVLAVAQELEDARAVRLGQGGEAGERVDRERGFRLVVVHGSMTILNAR